MPDNPHHAVNERQVLTAIMYKKPERKRERKQAELSSDISIGVVGEASLRARHSFFLARLDTSALVTSTPHPEEPTD
jgi:hypothetical protein